MIYRILSVTKTNDGYFVSGVKDHYGEGFDKGKQVYFHAEIKENHSIIHSLEETSDEDFDEVVSIIKKERIRILMGFFGDIIVKGTDEQRKEEMEFLIGRNLYKKEFEESIL